MSPTKEMRCSWSGRADCLFSAATHLPAAGAGPAVVVQCALGAAPAGLIAPESGRPDVARRLLPNVHTLQLAVRCLAGGVDSVEVDGDEQRQRREAEEQQAGDEVDAQLGFPGFVVELQVGRAEQGGGQGREATKAH